MKDDSLLDTGVIFEIPLEFTQDTADLSFQALYEVEPNSNDKRVELFKISLENLTYSGSNTPPDIPNEPEDDVTEYLIR
jgi:hypothetical protein